MDKEQDKKQYELSFLAKEEGVASAIAGFIRDLGGEIELESPAAKITLAYPIKKATAGYFGYFHFSMSPEEIKHLDRQLETNLNVLRHLTITPPFKKAPLRMRSEDVSHSPEKISPPRPAESKPEILTNEELERKIEEILK